MSKYSLLGLQKKNARIYRLSWLVFFSGFLVGLGVLIFSIKSNSNSNKCTHLITELNEFSKKVNSTGNRIKQVLLLEEGLSNAKSEHLKTELATINTELDQLIIELNSYDVGFVIKDSIAVLCKDIKRHYKNFNGIAILIVNGNSGVEDNTEVFKSQLLGHLTSLENDLADLRIIGIVYVNESFQLVLMYNMFIGGIILVLVIMGYYLILNPLKKSFEKSKDLEETRRIEMVTSVKKVNTAVQMQKEAELKLKTKNSQVIKLQESLSESIKQINSLGKDKSLIYLNAASDLEGYLKVVNLQKEIIENQTNVSRNDSWRPLTSAISQLNSLVGDYFSKSRSEMNEQTHSEVYLSQLISEIILSISISGSSVFEQMADMPSFKTNVDLFKNVLQPYFDLISSVENVGSVKVSALESGNFCEIKFVGLSKKFVKEVVKIENLKMIEMSFIEFKIHMAKSTIIERGGKVWIQDDVVKKGVLSLRWAL